MFENSRRGKQARNFTTKVPKILDLKLSSECSDIFRKLTLGVPELYERKRFSPITFLGKPTCNKPALPSQRLLRVFFCYSFGQSIFYSYNTLLSSQHPYYLNVFKTFDSTRSVMSALIFFSCYLCYCSTIVFFVIQLWLYFIFTNQILPALFVLSNSLCCQSHRPALLMFRSYDKKISPFWKGVYNNFVSVIFLSSLNAQCQERLSHVYLSIVGI